MSDRKVKGFVIFAAVILLLVGCILFYIFDKQGIKKNKINDYINYNIDDYIEIIPVLFDEYNDVYSNIDVSRIKIRNLNNELIIDFLEEEEKIIGYVREYYDEIKSHNIYNSINNVRTTIKSQISGTVLSIFYRMDFNLDNNIFLDSVKSYFITYNIDLSSKKILSNNDLLSKYNYSKEYISEKLYNDDILIDNGQIVIDKETNISFTKNDIERKKKEYIEKITCEFDNIIVMYIENHSLVLVYDKKVIKNLFFDNRFNTEIQLRYLK